MSLVTRVDQSYADGDEFVGSGADGLHTLLLAAGWELLEEIDADPGEQDRVYYSEGEDGYQALYLRVTHSAVDSRVSFRAYSLWDEATSTGYDEIGDTAGSTCIQYPVVAFDAWVVVNADSLALVIDYDGGTTYNKFFGGRITPLTAPQNTFNGRLGPAEDGRNESGDNRLRMATGTDYSGLQADQYLWVVSQSASTPGISERVRVSSWDEPTETIFLHNPLVESHSMGSLVSMTPQEVILWGSSGGQLSTSPVYALHNTDVYEESQLSWTDFLDFIGLATIPSTDYGEYPLAPVILYDTAVDQKNTFGLLTRFRRAPTGSAASEDTFTAGSNQSVNFADGGGFFALQVT